MFDVCFVFCCLMSDIFITFFRSNVFRRLMSLDVWYLLMFNIFWFLIYFHVFWCLIIVMSFEVIWCLKSFEVFLWCLICVMSFDVWSLLMSVCDVWCLLMSDMCNVTACERHLTGTFFPGQLFPPAVKSTKNPPAKLLSLTSLSNIPQYLIQQAKYCFSTLTSIKYSSTFDSAS